MTDEPEIVKQLKKEERLGTLRSSEQSAFDVPSFYEGHEKRGENEMTQINNHDLPRGETIQVNIETQRRLLEAEEKYEKIFRLSPDAIVLINKKGIILDINERLREWLGFQTEEVIGKNILELPLFTPEGKVKVKKNFLLRLSGKEVVPYETEFVTKKGEKKIGLIRATSIKDHLGNVVEDLVMVSDVTEQKQKENTLRQLAAIVESSDDAIIGKTLDGIVISWNKGAQKLYGYSAEEMIGRPISRLVPTDQENDIPRILTQIEKGENIKDYETIRMTKDGRCIFVSLKVSPVKDDDGKIICASVIARDITQRRKIEEDLKKKIDELERYKKVTIDREMMMVELKKKLTEMEEKLKNATETR